MKYKLIPGLVFYLQIMRRFDHKLVVQEMAF